MVILRALVIFLLFTSSAVATTEYVNTDCANNGNGTASTCADSGGGAGAFKTLAQAISAHDGGTLSSPLTINCRGNTADSPVVITGITTSSGNYLFITSDSTARHAGVWDDDKYTIATSGYDAVVRIRLPFVRMDGLQIYSNCASGNLCHGIGIESGTGSGNIIITNSIIKYYNASPTSGIIGIRSNSDDTTKTLRIINNIIYGQTGDGIYLNGKNNDINIIYSNSIWDVSGIGLDLAAYGSSDSFYIKNNLLSATGNDYYLESTASTLTTSKNITTDATSPDGASYQSKTITFAGSGDYHLASTESDAIDQGDDLSADGQYAFSTDIDGQTRSGTWDIGADEYQAAAAAGQQILTLRALGY